MWHSLPICVRCSGRGQPGHQNHQIGTGAALIQQRDAIQRAKLIASIDQVSSGRFLFGVGGGWNQREMENHGTVFATRFSGCANPSRR
jgi:hypothetical protein